MCTYRIGICDDEPNDLHAVLSMVKQYDRSNMLYIESYPHAYDLMLRAKEAPFDIILVDIEMSPPNGFDIAKEIRGWEDPPSIIFTTKSRVHALKGYGIALRYLQKPLVQHELFEAMDAALLELQKNKLVLKMDEATHVIPLNKIRYIEVFGHDIVIHLDKDEFRTKRSLSSILSQLPPWYFAVPHRSYIVNLEHIDSASSTEITMDNGAAIPISRGKAAEFNTTFYQYLRR